MRLGQSWQTLFLVVLAFYILQHIPESQLVHAGHRMGRVIWEIAFSSNIVCILWVLTICSCAPVFSCMYQ